MIKTFNQLEKDDILYSYKPGDVFIKKYSCVSILEDYQFLVKNDFGMFEIIRGETILTSIKGIKDKIKKIREIKKIKIVECMIKNDISTKELKKILDDITTNKGV